ncbi:flavodoxin [Clostridium beijerinckii]|nr:flavodoxin [Clostridium beijerinckii]
MKKLFTFMITCVLLFSFGGCSKTGTSSTDNLKSDSSDTAKQGTDSVSSQSEASKESASSSKPNAPTEKGSKTLVVYFSMPETTDPNNMTKAEDDSTVVIDGKVLGNTQYMAYVIQENTGADIFRIEPETPYPTDHTNLVDLAAEEQKKNARPVIKSHIDNIEQYDTIFLGYPNWWGDMPMILYSFLDEYDLSGKTVIPFNSHGGSGFSNTISSIAKLEPNATVNKKGYTVSRNKVEEDAPNIISWINDLGYAK